MAEAEKKPDTAPFVISRLFDAPRDIVFKSFTDPDRLKHWWGPKGFKVIAASMDFRPGGMFHYGLKAPDGSTMWGRFVYREIAAPERLVYVGSFSDEKGGLARHPLHMKWPLELLTNVTFADAGAERTKVTVSWLPIGASAEEARTFDENRPSMTQGWGGTFENLETYLAGGA